MPEKTDSSTLLTGALQVAAGIVGAGALFSAIGTFAGWQYLRAYHEEFGIPFSVLSFSTQEFLFAATPIVVFTFAGVLGGTIGLSIALVLRNTMTIKDIADGIVTFLQGTIPWVFAKISRKSEPWLTWFVKWPFSAQARETERPARPTPTQLAQFVAYGLILLAGLATLAYFGIDRLAGRLGGIYGPKVGLAILINGLTSLTVVFFVAVFLRSDTSAASAAPAESDASDIPEDSAASDVPDASFASAAPTESDAPDVPEDSAASDASARWLLVISILAVVIFSGMLVFMPSFIGRSQAEHDSDDPSQFKTVTIVTTGAAGVGPELSEDCSETLEGAAPTLTCEITGMVVILRNNGFYFISPNKVMELKDRPVYQIAEDRIVQVSFNPQ